MLTLKHLYLIAFHPLLGNTTEFVQAWFLQNPNRIPAPYNLETVGQFFAEKITDIQQISALLERRTSNIPLLPDASSTMKLIKDLNHEWHTQLDFTSLMDALFMIMRGHNVQLENPAELNKPACPEGAYLGIIKELVEVIFATPGVKLIQYVEVVDCSS